MPDENASGSAAQGNTDPATGTGATGESSTAPGAAGQAAGAAAAGAGGEGQGGQAGAQGAAAVTPAGSQEGQQGQAGTGAAAAPVIPDTYTLEKPEGYNGELEPYHAAARASRLSNEQAQLMLNQLGTMGAATRDGFLTRLNAMEEIGGPKLDAVQSRVRSFIEPFLPADSELGKEFRQVLTANGFGNWPPWVVLINNIAQKYGSEDRPSAGSGGSGGATKMPWETMYDHPTSQSAQTKGASR